MPPVLAIQGWVSAGRNLFLPHGVAKTGRNYFLPVSAGIKWQKVAESGKNLRDSVCKGGSGLVW